MPVIQPKIYPICVNLILSESGPKCASFEYIFTHIDKENRGTWPVLLATLKYLAVKKLILSCFYRIFYGGSQDPLWQLSAIIGLLQISLGPRANLPELGDSKKTGTSKCNRA